jgi:hypothetical protein
VKAEEDSKLRTLLALPEQQMSLPVLGHTAASAGFAVSLSLSLRHFGWWLEVADWFPFGLLIMNNLR